MRTQTRVTCGGDAIKANEGEETRGSSAEDPVHPERDEAPRAQRAQAVERAAQEDEGPELRGPQTPTSPALPANLEPLAAASARL